MDNEGWISDYINSPVEWLHSFKFPCCGFVCLPRSGQRQPTLYSLLLWKQGSSPAASRPTTKISQTMANHISICTCTFFEQVWNHRQWRTELLRLLWLKNFLPRTRILSLFFFKSLVAQKGCFWRSILQYIFKRQLWFRSTVFEKQNTLRNMNVICPSLVQGA